MPFPDHGERQKLKFSSVHFVYTYIIISHSMCVCVWPMSSQTETYVERVNSTGLAGQVAFAD